MDEWRELLHRHAVDFFSVHDSYGRYLYVSPNVHDVLGHRPADLLGLAAYDLFHPEDVETIGTSHGASLHQGEPNLVQYRIRCADGRYRWVETSSRTVERSPEDRGTIVTVTRPIDHREPRVANVAWL